VATEENIGDDGCAQRELVFRLCMRVEAIIPVHVFFVASITLGAMSVGKAEEFCSERSSRKIDMSASAT